MLTEIWREADQLETLRLQRKASGCREDDMEDALPEHVNESFRDRWIKRYNFELLLSETLCEPLVGRIKREFDRKSQSLIQVDRSARLGRLPGQAQARSSKWPKM